MKRVTVTTTLALCLLLAWAIGASYAETPWRLFGVYLESCSCDIPCQCPVGGEPTNKTCQGFLNWRIIQGFYGDVLLNDVNVTIMVDIPGMTGEGGWTIATYIDDTASPEQIEAIQSVIQESLGELIAEDLGVKSVPIDFGKVIEEDRTFRHGMSGDTYKWTIPDILEIESTLRRDLPDVPGFFGPTYYQAEAVVQTYNDYGREWDFAGKNSFQGRLVLPSEEPSDRIAGTIRTGAFPSGGSVNPYTRTAVVANGADATLSLIDLATRQVTKTIPVGASPLHPAVNSYTNVAVVANNGDGEGNDVSIVDLTAGEEIARIPVGKGPICPMIPDPVMNLALIANQGGDSVSVIDLNTLSVVDTITVGIQAMCFITGADWETMTAMVSIPVTNELVIIDLTKIPRATEDFSNTFFLSLESGLNMLSVPLKGYTPLTARDLMDEIGATVVIEYDTKRGRFVGFTAASSGDGFAIEGGKGYIVNVTESKIVPFVGAAWTNEPSVEAAPPAKSNPSGWAFIVSGAMIDAQGSDYTVAVRNLRTGAVATDAIADSRFDAVFADLNRNTVIEAGDKVELVIRDGSNKIVAGPVTYQIGQEDIRKAFRDIVIPYGYARPKKNVLLQNYPNPFNPETWIPFHLAQDADISVRIYDASGKLIRALSLGHREAGIYVKKDKAVYWDGKSDAGEEVASGVYFYNINAGAFSATKKLIMRK